MTRPRKKEPCGYCKGAIRGRAETFDHIGTVHTDCAADIERAIALGGCSREEWLRSFSLAMG